MSRSHLFGQNYQRQLKRYLRWTRRNFSDRVVFLFPHSKGVSGTTWSKPGGGVGGGATGGGATGEGPQGGAAEPLERSVTWSPQLGASLKERGTSRQPGGRLLQPEDTGAWTRARHRGTASLALLPLVPQGPAWIPTTNMPINFTVVPVEDAEGGGSSAAAAGGTKADISVPTVVLGEDGDRCQAQSSGTSLTCRAPAARFCPGSRFRRWINSVIID